LIQCNILTDYFFFFSEQFIGGIAFWLMFHNLDSDEEAQNEIGREGRDGERVTKDGGVE